MKLRSKSLALISAAALFVLFVGLLHTPPVRRFALSRAGEYLRRAQGIEFRAAHLHYNLLTLSAWLENVSLQSTAAAGLPPFLTFDSAHIRFGFAGLLRGRPEIRVARLSGTRLQVVRDAKGTDNLPVAPAKDKEPSDPNAPLGFLITSLEARQASILLADQQQNLEVQLPRWTLRIEGDANTLAHGVHFRTDDAGSVRLEDRSIPVQSLSIDSVLRAGAFEVKQLQLDAADSRIRIAGRLEDFSKPELNVSVGTDLNMATLSRFAGLTKEIGGRLRGEASGQGPLEKLVVSAEISGENLSIRDLRRISLTAKSRWDRGSQQIHVESMALRFPGGSVTGRADLALSKEAGKSSLQADIRNLDLENVSRILGAPVQIASRATAVVRAQWQGLEFERASGEAKIQLRPSRAEPSRNILPISASLSATARADSILIDVDELEALGSRSEAQVSLRSRRELGGEIHLEVASVEQLASELETLLGREPGSLTKAGLKGSLSLQTQLGGTVDHPEASAVLESPGLDVGEVREIRLQASAKYSPERAVLESLIADWQGQRLRAQGEIGLAQKSTPLSLSASVEQGSLAAILAGIGQKVPVDAAVDFNGSIRGTLENPDASVSVHATDLKAYGEELGSLELEASLSGQNLRLTKLRLDRPPGSGQPGYVQATGVYNLASREYVLDSEGRNVRFTDLTLRENLPVRGELNFSASGTGTADNPDFMMKADLGGLRVGQQDVGEVDVSAMVRNYRAVLETKVPRFNLAVNASVQTRDSYPAELEISANKSDLSLLAVNAPGGDAPLRGRLTASVKGSGDLAAWQEGQLSAQVSDLLVTIQDLDIRNDGPVEFFYEGGVLRVQPSTITASGSRLELNGWLPLRDSGTPGSLNIRGVFDVAGLLALAPAGQGFSGEGNLILDATLRGSLQSMDPTIALSLPAGSLRHPSLSEAITNINLDLLLRKGAVVIRKLAANLGPGSVRAAGEVPLGSLPASLPLSLEPKQGPAEFSLDLENLDLRAFRDTPEDVEGTISLHVEGETPRVDDWAALRVKADFQQLRLKVAGYEVQQEGSSAISMSGGSVRIDRFVLSGERTRLEASGTADLTETRSLDLRLAGNLDVAVLTLLTGGFKAQGDSRLQLALTGDLNKPVLSGFFEMEQGQIGLQTPRLLAENLDVRLNFGSDRVTIERLSGSLNGGTLTGSGSIAYRGGELNEFQVDLSTDGAYLNFPEGLKTQVRADLNVRSQDQYIVLGGKLRILEGSYREPLVLSGGILDYFESGSDVEFVEERNPFLSRIRYNISVETVGPLLIDNNLAKLTVEENLRLVGSYYRPGLTGRITLDEGGRLYLSEKEYFIDRGVVSFVNETRIEPILDILAQTRASGYDINLKISGSLGDLSTTFTSDPPLSQPNIISVLLTGRTLDEVQGAELNVAREQVASYLSGQLSGLVSRSAQESLGLSQVKIEPSLINPESKPGARLTLGKDLTDHLQLIYSMNLADSGDQIYVMEYDVTKRFETQATKQSDNSYRFDFRHDVRFGERPLTGDPSGGTSRTRQWIGGITFHGNSVFPEDTLSEKLKLKPGDEYDFFKLQKGVDRVANHYDKNGYLEARVRVGRQAKEAGIDLSVQIQEGPRVEFVYEGLSVPGAVRKQVRRIWAEGLFDAQRAEEASRTIRSFLVEKHYLESKVAYDIKTASPGEKQVTFEVSHGPRYGDVPLVFEGASGIKPPALKSTLKTAKLETEVYTAPANVASFLSRFYQQSGYLDAKVDMPGYELDPEKGAGRVVIPIDEGPLYRIGSLEFEGNNVRPDPELENAIPLSPGGEYRPQRLQDSVSKLEELYWLAGYNDVVVNYALKRSDKPGLVDVAFKITENKQDIVKKIEVDGNRRTSESLIRSQVSLSTGQPLDFKKTNQSRKDLYDTGAYSLVEIQPKPVESAEPTVAGDKRPVALQVNVKEVRPFELRYGAFYDTDRGPGAIADLYNRNSLGAARLVGVRTRYDSDIRELRGYFSQPLFRGSRVRTNTTGFARRELFDTFITDRTGFTIDQEHDFGDKFILSYGYWFERTHTYDKDPESIFKVPPFHTAPLTTSVTREGRDDILDATRGYFTSHTFQYAPSFLGSDLQFVKYFGQYFKYVPLTKPAEVPFGKGLKRPRFVYAGAVRVGLGAGLRDQDLIRTEKFFAGGGTTIRGFSLNSLGPVDFLGDPTGGNAVLITNNEIRFPLFSLFDGVAFLDIGNVYDKIGDFSLSDVRKSSGFGLRVRTPYILLRLDYGFKLDRRPGESLGKLFFSIGQAF